MKFWIISLFDPTPIDKTAVGRYIGIANAAKRRSIDIIHFTSTFRHTGKKHRFDEDTFIKDSDSYRIYYLHSMGYANNMSPKRFYAHHIYATKLINAFKKLENPDIILLSMPPLSIAYEVSKWAYENKIPFVIDIIDPWPDSFIKDIPNYLKFIGKPLLWPFRRKLIQSIEASSAIIGISREYVEWAKRQSRKARAKPSEYFFPAVDLDSVQNELSYIEKKYNDKLTLVYAGSLASSYDISSILEAAKYFDEFYHGRTHFYIAGIGPKQKKVIEYASQHKNIEYLGMLNRGELFKVYKNSDLGVMQHMNSLTQTVTYKVFSYLSAGLPILNSLQSEVVHIIEENKVGLCNKEQDVNSLISNIEIYLNDKNRLEEEKVNAINTTKRLGDSKTVYEKLVDFLIKISNCHL
jgi:glycosyltransferase involved in cell wall biosynthesis